MTSSWLLFLFDDCLLGCCSHSLSVLLVFVDSPIEDIVVLEGFADEEIAEDLTEIGVVRLVVEAERSSVVEVDCKLVREASTEHLCRRSHLLLHDTVILLLFRCSFETLPWERASAEVQHDIAQGFHVVTTGLL